MQVFLLVGLFIAILAILFALQNVDPATVSFIVWDFEGSLALILLIAMAAGALISSFFSLPSNLKARWTIRNQRKKMDEMGTTIVELQTTVEEQKTELQENLNKFKEMQIPPQKPALPVYSDEFQQEDESTLQDEV